MTWSMLYNVACVDVGATQGQSKYIQQLKRDMYKKKNDCTKNKRQLAYIASRNLL